MTVTEFSDSAPFIPMQSPEWFIVAKLEHLTLVFPSALVAETFLIERSQILALPFYDPAILGCIHQSGQIVPLVAIYQFLGIERGLNRENLTIIRLSHAARDVAGIGLAVDTILGRKSREQLPPKLFDPSQSSASSTRLFRPEIIGDRLWQPQRWDAEHLQSVG